MKKIIISFLLLSVLLQAKEMIVVGRGFYDTEKNIVPLITKGWKVKEISSVQESDNFSQVMIVLEKKTIITTTITCNFSELANKITSSTKNGWILKDMIYNEKSDKHVLIFTKED